METSAQSLHIGFIRNNNEVSSIFSLLLVTFLSQNQLQLYLDQFQFHFQISFHISFLNFNSIAKSRFLRKFCKGINNQRVTPGAPKSGLNFDFCLL